MLVLVLAVAVLLLWLTGQSQNGGGGSQPDAGKSVSSYDPLSLFTQGWAQAEGYNVSGSRAQRNNNPVNLTGSNYPGAIGTDSGGFTIFDSPASGWNAAQGYVSRNAAANPGWTFQNFFAKVLGNLLGQPVNNDQGNSNQEASNVASYLGVAPDTNLSQYIGG